jgi:predicted MPP superfamily phosphohydrolase
VQEVEKFMAQHLKQKKGTSITLIKRCVITLLIISCSVILSFAETNNTLSQKLDLLHKIQGKFTFVVIGDNKTGKGDDTIYRELIMQAMKQRPDFIVNVGDMIQSPNEKLWAHFKEVSKPVTVPYFFTVGNHDVSDKKSEELYRKQVDLPGNELYYTFAVGKSLFVVLDSNISGQNQKITSKQYKWLKVVLSSSEFKHTFIFVHHPLFPEKRRGNHYGDSLDKDPKRRDRLQALFVKYKVTIVFQGHEHLYMRKTVDGITHIITGGGGAPLYTDEKNGGFYHFVLVTADGDIVKGQVIDNEGKVRDTFQLKR